MPETYPRGWHPDPYGLHAERFFYAENQPGRLVRDANRVEFYDEVPAGTPFAPPGYTVPPPPVVRRADVAPAASLPAPAPAPALHQSSTPPQAEPHNSPPGESPGEAEPARGLSPGAWRAAPDRFYFPDESVPWRLRLTARLSRIRRPEWLPRTAWLVVGVVALVILGSVLIVVLPSSSGHSPAQATTNPQLVVPGNFLNGGHGSGATTTTSQSPTASTAASAATQSWKTNASYASSSMNLTGIACPLSTQCYAVGESAFKSAMVLASTDGGTSWSQQNVPVPGPLTAIACSSPTSCVAVGGTTVASTTDGGTTWTSRQLGSVALTGVTCPSASTCIAVGSDAPQPAGCSSGITYSTHNGGQSWVPTPTRCFTPSGISCANAASCMMSGVQATGNANFGAVMRSIDGGKIWKSAKVLSQPNTELAALTCPLSTTCVAVGNSSSQPIIRTVDSGASWAAAVPSMPTGESNSYLAVSCASASACQAGGLNGAADTTDGKTWAPVSLPAVILKVTGLACPTASQCNGVAIGQLAAPWTITLSA
jgi:photosystem II stability/assembly factor-like uncharacterized protein